MYDCERKCVVRNAIKMYTVCIVQKCCSFSQSLVVISFSPGARVELEDPRHPDVSNDQNAPFGHGVDVEL